MATEPLADCYERPEKMNSVNVWMVIYTHVVCLIGSFIESFQLITEILLPRLA